MRLCSPRAQSRHRWQRCLGAAAPQLAPLSGRRLVLYSLEALVTLHLRHVECVQLVHSLLKHIFCLLKDSVLDSILQRFVRRVRWRLDLIGDFLLIQPGLLLITVEERELLQWDQLA